MAGVSEKGVKELPTDSPYKPCFNKPLPATSFHWLNRGRAGIYSSVPVIWWWLPRLFAPPPLPHPFMPAAAASLQLSWLLLSLCSTYTSRYDFWGIVKQLLENSCSSLISARHWERGTGRGLKGLNTQSWVFSSKNAAHATWCLVPNVHPNSENAICHI